MALTPYGVRVAVVVSPCDLLERLEVRAEWIVGKPSAEVGYMKLKPVRELEVRTLKGKWSGTGIL